MRNNRRLSHRLAVRKVEGYLRIGALILECLHLIMAISHLVSGLRW